jgi:hypothetical protein
MGCTRRNTTPKPALTTDTPSMNQNKNLQVRGDTNHPGNAAGTSKKRLRNPLSNDGNEESGDDVAISESDSSNEEIQILPIVYPPTTNVDILWWDENTKDNTLRVGTILGEGNDTHAYKIEFRDGTTRYPTLREMESRCVAHNKLVESDNELILKRIQFALNDSGEPTEQTRNQLAELATHVRNHRFQEARDTMMSLVKSTSVPPSNMSATFVGTISQETSIALSPNIPLPANSLGGTISKERPSSPTPDTALTANALGQQQPTNMSVLVVKEPLLAITTDTRTNASENLEQGEDRDLIDNGENDDMAQGGSQSAAEESGTSAPAEHTIEKPHPTSHSPSKNPPPPPTSAPTLIEMELPVFKAAPTSIEEARNQMKCLMLFERNFKNQKRES